ncbi:MAG: hypothetical protein H3Z53_05635 [archaeon]|nr:hypothetical protein [archaeon]MCP8313838.1 hypothetical protein [archaeon]
MSRMGMEYVIARPKGIWVCPKPIPVLEGVFFSGAMGRCNADAGFPSIGSPLVAINIDLAIQLPLYQERQVRVESDIPSAEYRERQIVVESDMPSAEYQERQKKTDEVLTAV